MMRTRTVGKNLLFAAVTLAAFAGVVELLLQFLMPLVYRPRFTDVDPTFGWTHNVSVGTVSTVEGHTFRESYNRHGYRSPEHGLTKPPGTLRLAMLGDSFVDGSEVGDEELLTWHLQQTLSGVEVINLGVYGYSTAQEAITLERVALSYNPDLVVLVTVPNDFWGNGFNFNYFGPAPRFMLDGDSLRYESTRSPEAQAVFRATNLPVPGMTFLHEHSLLYYFVNHFVYQRLIAGRLKGVLETQRRALSPADQMELYRRLVRRMKQLCDKRAVDFLVAFAYERPELIAGPSSPNGQLARLLETEGIPTIDLYSGLREAELGADSSYYYRENIHWNVRGHRLVADLLRPKVERWIRDHARTSP